MLESLLGFSAGAVLGILGGLAALVSIIVEVLKGSLPKSFPTKLLVLIVSLGVTMGFIIITCTISIKIILLGFTASFVVGFISMYGFDTLREIINRYKYKRELENKDSDKK